jgi:hypothetical protein
MLVRSTRNDSAHGVASRRADELVFCTAEVSLWRVPSIGTSVMLSRSSVEEIDVSRRSRRIAVHTPTISPSRAPRSRLGTWRGLTGRLDT